MWPDEENESEYEENERCGDVERDEVKGLVEDEDREELSGFLSW